MFSNVKDRDFFIGDPAGNGGVTGSGKILGHDHCWYQLKNSIQDAQWFRRIKALGYDHENFGEVIASRIAKLLMPEDPTNPGPRIPDVSLVANEPKKSVGVASLFITGDRVETLNDYIDPKTERPFRDPNAQKKRLIDIKLVAHNPEFPSYQRNLNAPKNAWLFKELAQAVAVSALLGDHDVNPGNMLVITEKNKSRIARIDFGHAFADQLRFPRFGGKRIHPNSILDFFNRRTLDGVPNAGESKLWRAYPALVPSQAMVEAMKGLTGKESKDKIRQGIQSAKEDFQALLRRPEKNKMGIMESLQYIAERISERKVLINHKKTAVDRIFQAMEDYVCNNVDQMIYAADIMQLQLDIDTVIRLQQKNPVILLTRDFEKLNERYKALQQDERGPFSWIKTSEKFAAFQGNLDEYIQFRREENKDEVLLDQSSELASGSEQGESLIFDSDDSSIENTIETTRHYRDIVESWRQSEEQNELNNSSKIIPE